MLHVGKEFSHGVEWKPLVSKVIVPHRQRKAQIEDNWEAATDLVFVVNLRCKANSGEGVLNINPAVVCIQVKN